MPAASVSRRDGRTALILYGSETGNAHDAAEELGRLAERLHFLTRVVELDSVDPAAFNDFSVVVISISTTGQGDLPANARIFWKSLLRKRLSPDFLISSIFTVFGLGDSSYPKFNWAARKLQKRLLQLGAEEFCLRGEADEQHPEGLDGTFVPWSQTLRERLLEHFPLDPGFEPIGEDVLLQPKWTLELLDEYSSRSTTESKTEGVPSSNGAQNSDRLPPNDRLPIKGAITMTLAKNERATPTTHWQDVRHLTFTTIAPITYVPGDVLTIFPKNFPQDVNSFISLMGWEDVADQPVKFSPTAGSIDVRNYPSPPVAHLLPSPALTIRDLLTQYLDITSIPRRSFFALIAHFTDDPMHKERLLEFTNSEYIDELYDYTTRPRRSILEVLEEFTSVKIPWAWIGTVLPCLRGRQFSIASGGDLIDGPSGENSSLKQVELLVAIVKYRTVIKKIREGVCTRYLAPVVVIGPGTGIAPIRSLLWDRLKQSQTHQDSHRRPGNGPGYDDHRSTVGKAVLFYGCRNQHADYFYRDEWTQLSSKMDLQVFPAFSRDQQKKVYVQDLIREQSVVVYDLLHQRNGIVYICGSSGRMPQAVREALIEVFETEGQTSRATAEDWLLKMEKDGRYKQETW
ncbi:MAG: NAPDH-dependent diflavin reductase [Caeruleum heppii]|nr:MAG: NAPDH-dependent diflavin reductase [Caeruleum heppii]